MWFAEWGGHKIGRIAMDGTITEYATPTAKSRRRASRRGPDGAMWFTEHATSRIVSIGNRR